MTISKNLGLLAPQVSSSGNISYADLTNKPSLSTVATSGSYADLTNKPVVISLKGSTVTYPGDDLAADPAGAQTITITGTGFESTPTVYIGGTIAPAVTFVSATQISVTTPAKAAGTYDIYIVNPGGATAIMVFGISYSGTPTWTTAAGSLGSVDANFTVQLQAAGDAPVTYALTSGSTLPTGVTLNSSGLITGTGLNTEQTFNFSVTATDAQNQDTPRSFSVTVSIADPYFKYTTLLLSGDGANAAQNNTFLDSSANNFAITRNGNATQGSFGPYGSNWSTFFDGSQDNLYTPSTSALNVGSGNFTFECFFNVSVFNGGNIIRGSNQYSACALLLVGTGVVYYISSTGSSWDIAEGKTAIGSGLSAGVWYHLALVRNGNIVTPYVNGVAGTTTTTSATFSALNGLNIGAEQNGVAGGSFNGYISNVRIVVGTAVYTSNFTPPTANLTAISGTQLLACQNNQFKDNSSNNFSFTTVGTPSVQRFNPFGGSNAYSTSSIGGSGYFDGSGDYLSLLANSAFDYGTGDYTIEGWVYSSTTTWSLYATGGGGSSDQFCCDGGNLYWGYGITLFPGGGASNFFTSADLNQWVHIAMCRSSGTTRAFKNGVVMATSTVASAIGTPTNQPFIAVRTDGSYPLNGYMGGLRIVKGSAVYTSAFTPPTVPLTAVSGTSLLLNYTNSAIIDNAMMNNLETAGNAQISTSVVKYGTGSIAFDGTGDYLQIPYSPNLQFGTGAYTIEFWINTTVTDAWIMFNAATDTGIRVFITSTGKIQLNEQVSNVDNVSTSTTSINNGAWHHIALSRASGAGTKIFIDGVSEAQQSAAYNFSNTSTLYIGTRSSLVLFFNGYIDDLRITKGVARYTANFTPPASAHRTK